jgi:hypothetical protein
MRHLTKLVTTIAFPLFLVAYPLSILLPIERQEIENVPVDPPDLRFSELTSVAMYQEILSYVRSANPMRALLIRGAAGLDFWVFDDSPDPTRVLTGTDDWLFYRPTMEKPCLAPPHQVAVNAVDFVNRLEEDIPTVVFTIAPSKFVIHPEHLTAGQLRFSECARQAGAELRTLVARSSFSHYVDGWQLFERLKADGTQTYFRTDTHFNFEASIPWMQALIEEVDDIWDPNAVQHLGPTLWLGNLMSFISLDQPETVEHVVVRRQLSMTRTGIQPLINHYSHRGEEALVPGRALILGDSFMQLPEASLVQYFADVTVVDWRADGGVDYFLEQLSASSVVIIEVSELDIWDRFGDRSLLDRYESSRSG